MRRGHPASHAALWPAAAAPAGARAFHPAPVPCLCHLTPAVVSWRAWGPPARRSCSSSISSRCPSTPPRWVWPRCDTPAAVCAGGHRLDASWDTHTHTHTHTHTRTHTHTEWHNCMEAGLCLHGTMVALPFQRLAHSVSSELRTQRRLSSSQWVSGPSYGVCWRRQACKQLMPCLAPHQQVFFLMGWLLGCKVQDSPPAIPELPHLRTLIFTATALQIAASMPTDSQSAQVASHQAAQWLLLSGDVGAREFAWRLGVGLAQVRLFPSCVGTCLGTTCVQCAFV